MLGDKSEKNREVPKLKRVPSLMLKREAARINKEVIRVNFSFLDRLFL
ncbi:hypothetical protein F3D3_3053 [Fusibacter sp. 3D3]|nr:hypothetical protein F3D3_3053 [Fusibacter sp. 3D3]